MIAGTLIPPSNRLNLLHDIFQRCLLQNELSLQWSAHDRSGIQLLYGFQGLPRQCILVDFQFLHLGLKRKRCTDYEGILRLCNDLTNDGLLDKGSEACSGQNRLRTVMLGFLL